MFGVFKTFRLKNDRIYNSLGSISALQVQLVLFNPNKVNFETNFHNFALSFN